MTKIICLEGIDGCGKSTQIELLKQDKNVSCCWLRWKPFLLRPLYGIISLYKSRNKNIDKNNITATYNENKNIKKRIFRYKSVQSLWYIFSLIDYFFITKIKIVLSNNKDTKLMIFDRYFYDFVIDQGVNFNWTKKKYIKEIKRLSNLFKKPDITFLLNISPELSIYRKNDIPSIDYLENRYVIYNDLAIEFGWIIIDATLSKEKVNKIIKEEMRHL